MKKILISSALLLIAASAQAQNACSKLHKECIDSGIPLGKGRVTKCEKERATASGNQACLQHIAKHQKKHKKKSS